MNFLELDTNEVIPIVQKKHPELWELAIDTNNYITDFQYTLKANTNKLHELIGVSLYIRIITNYQALLILVSKGMLPQSQIMVRAQVEALFTLVAISKDNEFAEVYLGHEEHQRKGVLRKLRRYKETINSEDPDIQEATSIIEGINDNIKENNIKRLTTEETSKVAELHSWYDTVYALTSTAVHTSARSLETHLIKDNENEAIVSFNNEPSIQGIGLPLGTGVNSMHIATDACCDILSIEQTKEIRQFNERYERFHKNRT